MGVCPNIEQTNHYWEKNQAALQAGMTIPWLEQRTSSPSSPPPTVPRLVYHHHQKKRHGAADDDVEDDEAETARLTVEVLEEAVQRLERKLAYIHDTLLTDHQRRQTSA